MSDEACTRPFTEAAHRCGCGWLAVSTHGLTAGGSQSNRPGDSSMGSPRVYTRQVSRSGSHQHREPVAFQRVATDLYVAAGLDTLQVGRGQRVEKAGVVQKGIGTDNEPAAIAQRRSSE
jgi:hypothetical protein